ncbi:carbohydrate-binding protein [Pseudomonas aeruginosa]|uniref:carbohydrate-binding protein n=1 Tax=Pseudomonas aeruginosa TaxID=287 RepID=UPI000EB5B34D|nr:carbohydrate-binding protein [Pseudomonas aeruginosa]QIZ25474.1 carbohydrate-binding family V/XII protein [Pseudomonas aeruginosa]RQH90054.1 carbohydrate-binding family V/XII protein [Pseudomonas aeruginosa]HBO2743152.1 discoidin domain-containing protein [Pseudomonas aeruginosa]HCE7028191.1 discoidin domain-containing protein [Pseudomonas aeruginosa]HEK0156002.1 discoidin domain-containing protein [Pseudomonas aeruginosa]
MSCPTTHRITRSTRLWCAALGASMLLPQMASALAGQAGPDAVPSQQEVTLGGRFIDVQAVRGGALLRGAATLGTERLRQEAGVTIRSLRVQDDSAYPGFTLFAGALDGRARQPAGDIVMALRDDGGFVALLPERNAMIRGDADGQQTLTLFPAQDGNAHEHVDYLEAPDALAPALIESRNGALRYQAERNAAGDLLIDVLAGFSRLSVAYVGDHEAYALAQVASVNQALDNSKVKGVRVRLVGTQVIDDDHRVNTDTLADLKNLFAEGMRQYSPDLVAAFFTGRGSGPGQNTAAGWAYINGRYSVNAADGPTVFRHELGHNIGGGHCPSGQGFNYGYNNGRLGTIMCGNQLGYYSNPDLKDNQGVPIGDTLTANMAQVWRDNAARISAYAPSVVPVDDEQVTQVLHESFSLTKADNWKHFVVDVPAGTQRLAFGITSGARHEPTGRTAIYLKRDGRPSETDFDYRSREGVVAALGVSEEAAGRWYVSVKGNDVAIDDLILDGHAFAVESDSVRARYLRLVVESETSGKGGASAAEIQLADSRSRLLDPRSWRIHSVSSADGAKGAAANAIDGDPKTFWTTAPGAGFPHEMVIDLGQDSRFSHLRYLPRQDNSQVGNIKGYKLYASDNPYGGWVEVADGSFAADNKLKTQVLKPKESNLPPVAQIDGKREAEAGDLVVLDASASSDPQGAALSYTWAVSPALEMELDGPRLSFVAPSLAQDSGYRFTLTVDNGKQRVTQEHEVRVKAAKDASCQPAWLSGKAYLSGDVVQHRGRQYHARWWSQGQEPGNPSFTGADGSGKVWRDDGPCQQGEIQPPLAQISGKTEVAAGERVVLDASSSSDPNGLELSYRWSVSPALVFEADGPRLSFVAPKAAQASRYTFSLTLGNGSHSVNKEHAVRVAAEQPGTACGMVWSASKAYVGGDRVRHAGRQYAARWWSRGQQPGDPAFTGGEGSGKVWRDEGACF